MMSLIWNIRASMGLAALSALLLASAAADASMIEFTFAIPVMNCYRCATLPVLFSYELPAYPNLGDTFALAPPITVDAGDGYSATFVSVNELGGSGVRGWFFRGGPGSESNLLLMAEHFPGYSPGPIAFDVWSGNTDWRGPYDFRTFNGTGTLTIEEVNAGTPVLEPTTMALLLTGLAGAAGARLRRRLK